MWREVTDLVVGSKGNFTFATMEDTAKLKYLKGIILISIVFYVLFIVFNLIEGMWEVLPFFGFSGNALKRVMSVEAGIHYWANYADYLVQIVFMLLLNRFVRKYTRAKGYHFLLIILAMVPVVNYVLIFVFWRKLNREFFVHSGADPLKSDGKIVSIWFIQLGYLVLGISFALTVYFMKSPGLISAVGYYSRFADLGKAMYLLLISMLGLLYYLEFKRVLDRVEPGITAASLLDN